jgi:hypothetical protein
VTYRPYTNHYCNYCCRTTRHSVNIVGEITCLKCSLVCYPRADDKKSNGDEDKINVNGSPGPTD